jgi:hypothetical protein
MPPPPEEPTRPLRPAGAPLPQEPVYEREVVPPAEDPLLLDRLRSLRSAVVLLGLVAVAALALAVYALLTKEEETDTRAGASRERVVRLADRVRELESEVSDRATKDSVSQVADDQQSLGKRVDDVAKQASSAASDDNGGTDTQARTSINQLNQNVQTLSTSLKDLDQRVSDLESQSQP